MELSPEQRIAGVLTPLFALRSDSDLGIGDLATLREFVDWAAGIGFKLVQLLPINETGGDNSPYNAISALAIEPTTLHLAPGSPEDLTQEDYDAVLSGVNLKKLRSSTVHYAQVRKLKRALLEKAFARFQARDGEDPGLAAFAEQERSWLEDYAFFRALMEENGGSEAWDFWPKEQQSLGSAREWLQTQSGEVQKRVEQQEQFFRYVQWIAYTQWMQAKAYADERGVALMGDIPFGVSYYSADVFARP
ncbi:MAG: 4-alpha-glucanotransferase, partial [Verrucomicrobiota bacterium]|nr:4-alpha-glucanotransferase [Verrucomicrobiota bacterium]